MAPERTKGLGTQKKRPAESASGSASGNLPGVQKLKSAIRQTTRLLAKDKLDADVRVESERRLKSLQDDLAKAERSRTEKKMASKYHMVKFFERQKALRKIKQAKKELEGSDADGKIKKRLEKTLSEARRDLNYVLHFPKDRKYVSLYPSSSSQEADAEGDEKASSSTQTETDAVREEIRAWVKKSMKQSRMPAEPELVLKDGSATTHGAVEGEMDLDPDLERVDDQAEDDGEDQSSRATGTKRKDRTDPDRKTSNKKAKAGADSNVIPPPDASSKKKKKKDKTGSADSAAAATNLTLENDDFFE